MALVVARGGPRVAAAGGTVLAWSIYELGATSFAMNILSLHLPLDIASRVPRGNEKFSVAFSLSMLVVALLAPFLGRLADEKGKRPFLVPCVLLGAATTALIAIPGPVTQTLVFFAVANIAFQSAYVFYNALLPDVTDESTQGRVSGYGVAAGYAGSLLGMFLALPFVSATARGALPGPLASLVESLSVAPLVGDTWTRVNAYIPTAVLWLLAALPLLFFAKLPKPAPPPAAAVAVSPLAGVLQTLRSLPKTPSLLWFLAAMFLYFDVVHTVQIQMGAYSKFAIGFTDGETQKLLIAATAVAVLGGLFYGFLCQRVSIRTATLVSLANWILVFVLALVVTSKTAFYGVGFLAGIGLGGLKVTSRLGLVALVPKDRMAEFFGFFTLAGEAASVIGPLLWAAALSFFPDKSPTGYRVALLTLFVFLILALVAFLRVRFEDAPRE